MNVMQIKLVSLTAMLVFLFVGSTCGQEAVSPQKKALILQFIEATGGKKAADDMVDIMMDAQVTETTKMISSMIDDDKTISVSAKNQMKRSMTESSARSTERLRQFFKEKVDMGELIEEIVLPIYDKHFSESELKELVAFYNSTTGQKLISVMPELMMESLKVSSDKLVPKLQEFMKDAARSEIAQLKESVRPIATAPVRKSN